MQKQDYYYVKQIIIGLREEYQQIQRELDVLKQYVTYNKLFVEDINFRQRNSTHGYECEFYYKKIAMLEAIYAKLDEIFKIERYKNISYKPKNVEYLTLNENDEYLIKRNRGNKVEIINQQAFKEQLDKIKAREFSKNWTFNMSRYIDLSGHMDAGLSIIPKGIYITNMYPKNKPMRLMYNPIKDAIIVSDSIYRKENFFNQDDIQRVLDAKVPMKCLKQFYIDTIENSEAAKKEIILDGEIQGEYRTKTELKIIEEKRKIYIKK